MRLAFTITYNALHHLKHMDFAEFMTKHFDYWAIVDGLSLNGGSTWWCNNLTLPANSNDGTNEFIQELKSNHPNVLYHRTSEPFQSKDRQVNTALELLRTKAKQGYLWQVDADEKWTEEQINQAELHLEMSGKKQMGFMFNHYVGEGLVAKGEWGDNYVNRLWAWRGQRFDTHEPPVIYSSDYDIKSDLKFDHYSYYFEEDVAFKEKYYRGYEGLLDNWKALQQCTEFPQPLSMLMPRKSPHYNENTKIIKL